MNQPTSTDTTEQPRSDRERPFRYSGRLAGDIELRWQARWEKEQTFRALNPGDAGFDAAKPKFYCLDMFPYPSGAGLHVGHPEGYTATDIVSRYKRMKGFNVLHPIGFDAFGLPAEQYAIQTGVHPAITTRTAIEAFTKQLRRFGFSYDWSREFATINEDYYRWTQWIWLKAYHAWYDPDQNRARSIEELIEKFENNPSAIQMNPNHTLQRAEAWIERDVDTSSSQLWPHYLPFQQRAIIDSWRLVYLSNQTVNWCPKLGTALANEEVIDGRSEIGSFPVFKKPLKQWMFRITAFAERLLEDLDTLDWPDSTRTMQTAWIGRSEGASIDFPLVDPPQGDDIASLRVFTTRPDTLFGATYMVLAPEHPLVEQILDNPSPKTDSKQIASYVETAKNRTDVDRMMEAKEKTGVFTGLYATNPATEQAIPVWIADYVLMGYGTGAIMAVPGHDMRDFAFANEFKLPIKAVVMPNDGWLLAFGGYVTGRFNTDDYPDEVLEATQRYLHDPATFKSTYYLEGKAVNSENLEVSLNGLETEEATHKIIEWLEKTGHGCGTIQYKLHDWLFSRQRYWGEPFPVVFDEEGNHYPIAAENLPVVLPEMEDFKPEESDDPQPLLGKATHWVNTTAGEAGVDAKVLPPDTKVSRETNTMPQWAGSCWYYLRFCDPRPRYGARFVSRDAEKYWMGDEGVDLYIGGAEHAVLHLLYARFWHKILYDFGELNTPEPFRHLFHQGMITSFAYQREDKSLVPVDEVEVDPEGHAVETETGRPVTQIVAKMSKSLKNVINPDDVITEYGTDTFRLYEMYMGPLDASKPWNPRDIVGVFRFLQRVWRLAVNEETGVLSLTETRDEDVEKLLHRTIAKVGGDIERLAMNTAIAAMIEFVNSATARGGLCHDQLERFMIILAPFAPHIAEELFSKLGHDESITYATWPAYDESKLQDETIEIPVQIMGKVRGRITVPADADEDAIKSAAVSDPRIAAQLEGKTVRKVIVVRGRIVNIVAN